MEKKVNSICVVGAGSWGTALANLLAEKGYNVDLWVREQEVLAQIREDKENKVFLPGVRLSDNIRPVDTYEKAVRGKEIVMMAVPSHAFRRVLSELSPYLSPEAILLSVTKGIENETLMVMSEVSRDVIPQRDEKRFACLAGPSFAKEVSRRLPTAVTIACKDLRVSQMLQEVFYTEFFRVYASDDIIGVQLGGALKNVIAIAAGACDGLNFGHNARAALITRGLAEITRLGIAMGANPLTFAGLAGMGDLVLTCTGDLSRNRTVGLKIGKGYTIEKITKGMKMVAEGVKTAYSAYELSKKIQVEMPITDQVYGILYEKKDPLVAVKDLMTRSLKPEIEKIDPVN